MNERDQISQIRHSMGHSVVAVDVGGTQVRMPLERLCELALKGLQIAAPSSSLPRETQISSAPQDASEDMLEAFINAKSTQDTLVSMAREIVTQDVRATSHPRYCVRHTHIRHVRSAELHLDAVKWIDEDGNEAEGKMAEDLEQTFRRDTRTRIDVVFDDETSDYLRVDGETPYADSEYTKQYTRFEEQRRAVVVAEFFTNKAAEAYIEANKHNLHDMHVYVDSGYRNREWQFMRALIVAIGRPR